MNNREPLILGVLILWAILLAIPYGCGAGQAVLSGQARVIMETQPQRFSLYDRIHDQCLDGAVDLEGYRECMEPARIAARAVDAYADALETAQDVYTASGQDSFSQALPCVISAARRAAEALNDAGVPIPDQVMSVAGLIPEGACNE